MVFIDHTAAPSRRPTAFIGVYTKTLGTKCILVVKSNSGKWMLPGGMVDSGETAGKAAVRELQEESGIQIPQNKIVLIELINNCALFALMEPLKFATGNWAPTMDGIFSGRKPGETTQWGIVPLKMGEQFVANVPSGSDWQADRSAFRRGTVAHLNTLSDKLYTPT